MVAETQTGSVRDFPAYLHFTPRPDQPDKFDEQTAFYNCDSDGCIFLTGGNGAGTTSCLIAKICRFVLETSPPRRDTPFWVIAETYEQIGSMFDEKFNQQGHLPASVIDWPRIHWNNRNNNQPFRVPLKSPPGHTGKNWSLEFKSWRQGRGKMQARSLGGFGFIEQFPWGIFEEVLRGCREYNFPGSKMVEFTPVDADLSQNLEEMIENGYEPENPSPGLSYLPKNWKIFHANTLCAMEAGHVDKRWFEEFFGMVPKDMLETRLKGMFSTFEGVIYKDFNTGTHCMGDEMWGRIKNCYHRRGIDWGAGPENDFSCFDDKMEVLTDFGWKNFADITTDSKVMTMNLNTEVLEFQTPAAILCKPWDGDMITSEPRCEGVGFSVTPDHDMIVRNTHGGRLRKVTADHMFNHPNIKIPTTSGGLITGENMKQIQIQHVFGCKILPPVDVDHFAEFLGLWIAEGCLSSHKTNRHVCVAQKDHTEAVVKVLDALGWKYWKSTNNLGGAHKYTIASTSLYDWMASNGANKKSKHKRIPRVCFSWPQSAKMKLLEGMILGDGRKRSKAANPSHNDPRCVFTSSKLLADDIQELAVHLGLASKIKHSTNISGYTQTPLTMYDVTIMRSKQASAAKLPLKKEHYTGDVRCVSVPNGTLMVRRPGFVPFICGNCVWGAKNGLGQWFIYDEYVSHDQSRTTVDHLTEVYNQWEWPEESLMYGVSYADPSSPDNLRIAGKLNQYNTSVENISIQRGKNSVLEGIEHMQYLLKPQVPVPMLDSAGHPIIDPETGKCGVKLEPKLFIHRTNCPKLIQQMKTYRWLRGSDPSMKLSRNPRDPQRAPLKKNDHTVDSARYLCFSDDFMTGSTISSAKNHSALTDQLHGEYIPRQGLRGFTTQHRDRG